MTDEYRKKIGIPEGHDFKEVSSRRDVRRGQDADVYRYEEIDENGLVVAQYEIRDSVFIHPPFDRSVSFTKLG